MPRRGRRLRTQRLRAINRPIDDTGRGPYGRGDVIQLHPALSDQEKEQAISLTFEPEGDFENDLEVSILISIVTEHLLGPIAHDDGWGA